MRTESTLAVAVLSLAAAGVAPAQQRPPLRQLGPVVAVGTEPFVMVAGIRALSNGNVLVNDLVGRRVVMFDSTLAHMSVVADTTSATANAYGGRFAGIIPFRGDSTLFVDPASLSMMVVDPAGRIGRVMSVPRSQDAIFMVNGIGGTPGFDPAGRLVYRGSNRPAGPLTLLGGGKPGATQTLEAADTAPLLRVDLATRALDTLAFVRVPKSKMQMTQNDKGGFSVTTEVNPLPTVDEWAMLSDGTVAIVRGSDYHVDVIAADGTRRSAPKIPYNWQRLTDEDKLAVIDSVKAIRARAVELAAAAPATGSNVVAPAPQPGGGTAGAPPVTQRAGPAGAVAGALAGAGAGAGTITMIGGGRVGGAGPTVTYVQPGEMADYRPVFFTGAAKADAEGNLWVRTVATAAIPGGPVYDVISPRGELIDQVQAPTGRGIAGFGPGGTVFLTRTDSSGAVHLERARLR